MPDKTLLDVAYKAARATWKFLNTPFAIWLMSTVAIGSLSTAYADMQNCRKDYDTLIDQYQPASTELWQRYWALLTHMLDHSFNPSSEGQAAAMLDQQSFLAPFRDRGSFEIQQDARRTLAKLSRVANIVELRDCKITIRKCSIEEIVQRLNSGTEQKPEYADITKNLRPIIYDVGAVDITPRCSLRHSFVRLIAAD
jgi:hypothetical protein